MVLDFCNRKCNKWTYCVPIKGDSPFICSIFSWHTWMLVMFSGNIIYYMSLILNLQYCLTCHWNIISKIGFAHSELELMFYNRNGWIRHELYIYIYIYIYISIIINWARAVKLQVMDLINNLYLSHSANKKIIIMGHGCLVLQVRHMLLRFHTYPHIYYSKKWYEVAIT